MKVHDNPPPLFFSSLFFFEMEHKVHTEYQNVKL